MELKRYFKCFFSVSTFQPVETSILYDLYGTSDVIVMRERKKTPSDDDAQNDSGGSTKRDSD
jgi:hypothetical protein